MSLARAWKKSAKEHRAAARIAAQSFRRSDRIRRAYARRVQDLEQVLEELLVGAEQQSQSHIDVSTKCRTTLGIDQGYVDLLLNK